MRTLPGPARPEWPGASLDSRWDGPVPRVTIPCSETCLDRKRSFGVFIPCGVPLSSRCQWEISARLSLEASFPPFVCFGSFPPKGTALSSAARGRCPCCRCHVVTGSFQGSGGFLSEGNNIKLLVVAKQNRKHCNPERWRTWLLLLSPPQGGPLRPPRQGEAAGPAPSQLHGQGGHGQGHARPGEMSPSANPVCLMAESTRLWDRRLFCHMALLPS